MKCEQYWPLKGKSDYGDIRVEFIREEYWPDFTIRILKVMQVSSSTDCVSKMVEAAYFEFLSLQVAK